MAPSSILRDGGLLVIVGRAPLRVRPFGEDCEKACDIIRNLSGVFATYIAAEARTPEPARLFD
jgi:hypothetical protein